MSDANPNAIYHVVQKYENDAFFFFKNRKKVVNPEKCTRYIEIHLLIFSGHYFHHIGIRLPCIDDNTYDPASGNDPASGTLPIQQSELQ